MAVTYGADLVVNNTFEAALTGWSNTGTTTNTRSDEQAHGGTYSCKCVAAAANGGIYKGLWMEAGTWYLIEAWIYITAGGVRIQWDNQNITGDIVATDTWIKVRVIYRYTGANGNFFIRSYPTGAATFYVDDVYVYPITFSSTYVAQESYSADVDITTSITLPANVAPNYLVPKAGLILNIDLTANSYLLVYTNGGNVYVDEVVAGVYTANKIGATAITYVDAAPLRVQRVGTALHMWYNGLFVKTGTVTASTSKNFSEWNTDNDNTVSTADIVDQIIPVTNGRLHTTGQYLSITASDYDTRGTWGFVGSSLQAVKRINPDGSVVTATLTIAGVPFSIYAWDQDADGTNEQFFLYGVWVTADPTKILLYTYCNADAGGTTGMAAKSYVFIGTITADTGAAITIEVNPTPVLMLGDTDGSVANQIASVGILLANIGFLRLTEELPGGGGVGNLYVGEYNTNGSRTPGAANDQVRLLKSTDDGATWSVVGTWNTVGHQIIHIHSVAQDPYTGHIVVNAGDTNTESGVFYWDGVEAITANTAFGDYVAAGLYGANGSTKYKPINPLFGTNFYLSLSDVRYSDDTASDGFWKATRDLTTFTRTAPIDRNEGSGTIGWLGWKLGDTYFYIMTPGAGYANIYASNSESGPWVAVGKILQIGYYATSAVVVNSTTVMLGFAYGAMTPSNNYTMRLSVIGTFSSSEPVSLYPPSGIGGLSLGLGLGDGNKIPPRRRRR